MPHPNKKLTRQSLLSLAALLTVASPGFAQQSPPAAAPSQPITFDVDRVVRDSIVSSSQIETARRNLGIDSDRTSQIISQGKPNISASGRATRFDAATNVQFGAGPPVRVLENHTEEFALTASQRVDITGQIRAATNQARLQRLADTFLIDQLVSGRTLQAKTIFYTLLRARHQVQVAEAGLKSAKEQEALARKLFEGGIGQKIDVLRAATNVANAQQELTRASNAADIARANFNDLLGRPLDTAVEASDVAGVTVGEDVAPASAPVGTPSAQGGDLYTVPPGDVDKIDVEESIKAAQGQRGEVRQAEANVRAAELGVKLARAGNEPTLAFSATGSYFPTTSLQAPRDRTVALTAAVTFPIFDGGLTRSRVNEARSRTQNAQSTLNTSRTDVALQVRTAYLNLITAARQIESANAALRQAVAARQLAQVRYEGQVGLFLEVTDAQTALVRAQSAQVDAVYSYLTARAAFENALGANTDASVRGRNPSGQDGNPSAPGGNPPVGNPTTPPNTSPANPASGNPANPSVTNPSPGKPAAPPSGKPVTPPDGIIKSDR